MKFEVSKIFDGKSRPEMTIIRGIPGSGKSTLASSLASFHGGPIVVEADMWRMRKGHYIHEFRETHWAHRWCRQTAEAFLQAGKDVVVSNTFLKYNEMWDFVEYAYQHGFNLIMYTMLNDFGSLHDVPEDTMDSLRVMFKNASHQHFLDRINADFQR